MATTDIFARITQIYRGDGKVTLEAPVIFTNIQATTASFSLAGGTYRITLVGATFGTVTLQVLGGDGTTWLTATTAFSANGAVSVDLGPGTYRLAVA